MKQLNSRAFLVALAALPVLAGLPARAQDPGAVPAPAPSAEPAAETILLRLYDGGILWGQILGHDAQRLEFGRLDNGGRVRLPWSRLDPVQAEELQERFGYIDRTSDELLIEADRLVLADGREFVGRIVNRTDEALWLKTATAVIPVPKLKLKAAPTLVQAPALEVYTREELYQQEIAKLEAMRADSQFELARFCERILDYARAVEHYEAARTLEPEFRAPELGTLLERARVKAANQAQLDYLREIDRLRAQGKFDAALGLIQNFDTTFPGSPLRPDAMKRDKSVRKAREAALREAAVTSWHRWAEALARRAGRDTQVTFEAAMEFAGEVMRESILQEVHAELARTISASVTPSEVKQYFTERKPRRTRRASYGQGTWLLGERARQGLEPEPKGDEAQLSERDKARAELDERIRRYAQAQAAVSRSSNEQTQQEERTAFWSEWPALNKGMWILAYYVENGGDMKVTHVSFSNCVDCGGTGARDVEYVSATPGAAQGGSRGGGGAPAGGAPGSNNLRREQCRTCMNMGVLRRVDYR